jgi:hypothetical protein
MSSIRWHLSEGFVVPFDSSTPPFVLFLYTAVLNADIHCTCAGGFSEFRLMERLGEGQKPTVIIGEVADEWDLDLVVLSMEAIHSKHVDGNLLAEFIPCPVLLLPL